MTPAQLNTLAREAGFVVDCGRIYAPARECVVEAELARFASLVLEEAAKVCEASTRPRRSLSALMKGDPARAPCDIAAALRALAKQEGGEKL